MVFPSCAHTPSIPTRSASFSGDHYLLNRLPNKCGVITERKKERKTSTRGISIIIDVLQSRLHTLAHTVLNMTAPTEHDKFHNVEKKEGI